MPATPVYALPYPAATDPADVPADVGALANRIEAAIGPGTASGQIPVWDNASKTWKPGTAAGGELAYGEATANVTISATTEATANPIATCPAITLDGSTKILAEFFAPQVNTPTANGSLIVGHLFDGATSLGNWFVLINPGTATLAAMIYARRVLTPASGSHTFSARARATGVGGGGVSAGVGGAGNYLPAYLRITKA